MRENMSDREDRKVLKLFGQAERRSEEQMNKRVYKLHMEDKI